MIDNTGRLGAELEAPDRGVPDNLIELLNQVVKPPTPLTPDEIEIRAMYVVSDQINSFGGRFPQNERERLVELLIDSPVLIGHRKDKLPVGRTFHATLVERDGLPWVKAYFYWKRDTKQGRDLAKNIDAGIYRECSISFTFNRPECSICKQDIRECEHEPFRQYRHNGRTETCYFDYLQIEQVLETSLVYRGAVHGTAITRELVQPEHPSVPQRVKLASPDYLSNATEYRVIPRYDGLLIAIESGTRHLIESGTEFDLSDCLKLSAEQIAQLADHGIEDGLLVGYRGRERQSKRDLVAFLNGGESAVTRVVLYYLPKRTGPDNPKWDEDKIQVRPFPLRTGRRSVLNRMALEIKTKQGVELLPDDASLSKGTIYRYLPGTIERNPLNTYWFSKELNGDQKYLNLNSGATQLKLRLHSMNHEQPHKLTRFLAEQAAGDSHKGTTSVPQALCNHVEQLSIADSQIRFRVSGVLRGEFRGRPVKLQGREYLLFQKVNNDSQVRRLA